MRKLTIVSAALIFRTNPTFQLCVILLIMFGAYVCQTKYQPWMSNMEKAEVVEQHKEEIEILQDSINEVNDKKVTQYSHHSGADGRRFKKLTLGNTYEVKGRPTAERAAAFIWNYNTCESVLLCTCVIVAAMGVMFESAYLEEGSYAQETLSYMTLTLIAGSTTYYGIVCWSEIVGALNPRCSLSFLSGGALDESDEEEEGWWQCGCVG